MRHYSNVETELSDSVEVLDSLDHDGNIINLFDTTSISISKVIYILSLQWMS